MGIDAPAYRGNQVYEWLWGKSAHSFDEMTNLPKELRDELKESFGILPIQVDLMQRSSDGTIKNAVRLHDGNTVESVLIPTDSRTTACVSSQVGCSLNCRFCATARIQRMRNLSPGEIYDQVVTIDRQSRTFFGRPLSNIVFMGMGEPLMNYPNLIKSIDKITDPRGLGMSARRITVSTSGVPRMIRKLADEGTGCNLAVSLHSAIERIRTDIMPFNRQFPLPELLESLKYWYQVTGQRITFEYVVWKGINDNTESIEALIRYCRQVPSKVNLIRYNPIGDQEFEQAEKAWVDRYARDLSASGITVTIRKSRGDDIDAACGQLANKSLE